MVIGLMGVSLTDPSAQQLQPSGCDRSRLDIPLHSIELKSLIVLGPGCMLPLDMRNIRTAGA